MNALLFERPVWFATGPLMFEEEAQDHGGIHLSSSGPGARSDRAARATRPARSFSMRPAAAADTAKRS